MPDQAPLKPNRIIKTLAEYDVQYILVGALAARLQGFPRLTADADITPATDSRNLTQLAKALKKLNARVFTERVPEGLQFECTPKSLAQSKLLNLVTSAGRLDLIFEPAGTSGFDDLLKEAVEFEVYGEKLFAASLNDIIRSKKVSDRPQDRQDIIILREILNRRLSNEK